MSEMKGMHMSKILSHNYLGAEAKFEDEFFSASLSPNCHYMTSLPVFKKGTF